MTNKDTLSLFVIPVPVTGIHSAKTATKRQVFERGHPQVWIPVTGTGMTKVDV